MINYKSYIDSIPDFPKEGILYRDIQPLLANDKIFKQAISDMAQLVKLPDYWVAIESRGFLFASALSILCGGGVKLIRKKGKLPNKNLVSEAYGLEYGKDVLEMAANITDVKTAVIVDDVLATGGTLEAASVLCNRTGLTVIDKLCLLDIGMKASHDVKCLITYQPD